MVSKRQLLKGVRNPRDAMRYLARRSLEGIEPNLPIGTNVFERDWDVLILLDACRNDLFEQFAPKHDVYDYFDEVSSIYSVASTTHKWIPRTFDNAPTRILERTHYVTGTSVTEKSLEDDDLHRIDHVWKYAKDPNHGLTRPEAIMDAGIDAIRTSDADRIVLHYIQPHAPFLHCVGKYNSRSIDHGDTQNVWRGLRDGTYDKEEIWEDYGRNLLRGLDEVETVIRNTTGRVVVTSDHGNALGEWGIYAHPGWAPIKSIRKVPWGELDGLGIDDYDVRGKPAMTTEVAEPTVEDHLRALGYGE